MRRPPLLLGLLSALACGPEPAPTDTDGGASTSTGASTGAPTDTGEPTGTTGASTGTTSGAAACLDWEATDPGQDFPAALVCGLPEPCPGDVPLEFILDGGTLEAPDTVSTDDIARARCMARALRDRLPGTLRFRVPLDLGSDDHELEILGADAIRRRAYLNDFNFEKSARVRPLLPSSAYTACAEGTAKQVYACLVAGFEDVCAPGEPACP